ncbi:Hypothetical protein NTJ_02160 [Nesidiocoris tenuis]|uniref:KIND domain-containing protein n=1 Tax=Nesidiocoris tenuis TaxID=355587 RepID=A0ABN7AAM9_9HEMI|nr:Hypothetical protein NTJ_02160 [Nesidiocoris tenuis]
MNDDQQPKCMLDEDHCVSLKDILLSFNAPISEEHAWALCYQCAKCFRNAMRTDREKCSIVASISEILIHRDGQVHSNTIFRGGGHPDDCGGCGPSESEVS